MCVCIYIYIYIIYICIIYTKYIHILLYYSNTFPRTPLHAPRPSFPCETWILAQRRNVSNSINMYTSTNA